MGATFSIVRAIRVDGTPAAGESFSPDHVWRCVSRMLDETSLCAWATVTGDGRAHVNTGYFAYSEALHLYLLSHPHSMHCRNITTNPSMAVAVYASAQRWTDPGRGLQLFGTCAEVSASDAADAERVYARRFEAYAAWRSTLPVGDAALDYRFYRFVPRSLKILDEAEFGDAVWVQAEITGYD